MSLSEIAGALRRAGRVFERRPDLGLHDDSRAVARWQGGVRVATRHDNGTELSSDMPAELGGSGDRVTPGWLFRAGLAACATTSIAMTAARLGVALGSLQVEATSRTDARGMLGMAEADGATVCAGPGSVRLRITLGAAGVAPERLRALVHESLRCSPVPSVVERATPLELDIDVVESNAAAAAAA